MNYSDDDLRELWKELAKEKSGDELAWAFANRLLEEQPPETPEEILLAKVVAMKEPLTRMIAQSHLNLEAGRKSLECQEAMLLQITMFELAAEYPEIEAFNFTAEMTGTDEGEYYDPEFSVEFRDAYRDWDHSDERYWAPLRELGVLEEGPITLAFESENSWAGSITVEAVRGIFAGKSRGVAHA